MKKVLYFEGAGWAGAESSKETIGNCRIRTAFTNDEGRQIYLEMETAPKYKGKNIERYGLLISYVHWITDDEDDCNNSRIPFNYRDTIDNYNYSNEDITKWINKNLNCRFDNIVALPDLAGYRVHAENRGYNLVDGFIFDKELLEKREEVKGHFHEIEKSEGKKYPNFSLWVDEENKNILHLLRHFNGYNKHWTINTDIDDWKDSIEETKLGKYGC